MQNSDKNRFNLSAELSNETKIAQYLDLNHLIKLLKSNMYFICKKNKFEDIQERTLQIKQIFDIQEVGDNVISRKQPKTEMAGFGKNERYKLLSAKIYASCWTEQIQENILMWKNYTHKNGACIKSKISNFIAAFDNKYFSNYTVYCCRICYDNFIKNYSSFECNFVKRLCYSDEKEIRFLFCPNGEITESNLEAIYIPVYPEIMIEEIILSPYIGMKRAKYLQRILSTRFNIKVSLSKIELTLN